METQDRSNNETLPDKNRSHYASHTNTGRIFGGLIVVAVGAMLLAKQMGIYFPHWLFSWQALVIAIGLYIGVRHSFRNPVWIILVLAGTLFLADLIVPALGFKHYTWPLVIIAIGLIMIFRRHRGPQESWKTWHDVTTPTQLSQEDTLDSVTVFGGMKKNIFSKNFRGGELVTLFGGSELNLIQADIPGKIVLDITQLFGGTKLIIPTHWKIHYEDLVTIFGGVDDKRAVQHDALHDSEKVLILRGTCMFGGIDIKSF
jgi:predicted membrane protein